MDNNRCQIQCLPGIAEPLGIFEVLLQRRNRIRRIIKRRRNYLLNCLSEIGIGKRSETKISVADAAQKALHPGDIVKVRAREEIQSTLNRWNQLKGCSFMEEMDQYCGTTQRVFNRVEKFLDERDYLTKKCSGIVILEDVLCEGTRDFGPCDRSCFFFWREEWLRKLNG